MFMKILKGGACLDIKEFKMVVAQNIYYLRTINHLTQYELGQKLNYSDKAISKWERGDGLPDAYVLSNIAELFDVSVDYILTEHSEQDKKVETKPKTMIKNIIQCIANVAVFAVAVLIYVILYNMGIYHPFIFIYAIPTCAIIDIVMSAIWHKGRGNLIFTSILVWSTLATIYFAIGNFTLWTIFLIGVPLQIILFLILGIKITITFTKVDRKAKKKRLSDSEEIKEEKEE